MAGKIYDIVPNIEEGEGSTVHTILNLEHPVQ
jgi:hypothetical protein